MQATITRSAPLERSTDKEREEWFRLAHNFLNGRGERFVQLRTDGSSTPTVIWSGPIPENAQWQVDVRISGKQVGGSGFAHMRRLMSCSRSGVVGTTIWDELSAAQAVTDAVASNTLYIYVDDDGLATQWSGFVSVLEVISE